MEKKTFSAKNTAWNFQATWKCGGRGTLEQLETGWPDLPIETDGNQHTMGIHGRSKRDGHGIRD